MAIYWGIFKFAYELKGRRFRLGTDHRVLEEIRERPSFNNDKVNRLIEKIQGFDFMVEYNKGEELEVSDALSRLYEKETEKYSQDAGKQLQKQEHGGRIKVGEEEVHLSERDGVEWWQDDNGKEAIVPEEECRREMIKNVHESLMHRGRGAVYGNLRQSYYWPRIKNEIAEVLKDCEVCIVNNRKKTKNHDFVTTTHRMEKVAPNLIDIRDEGKYMVVTIDYFTQTAEAKRLPNKCSGGVVEALETMMKEGGIPEELVTDNWK